jgi:hypothetical protein
MTSTQLITDVVNYSTIAVNALGLGGGVIAGCAYIKDFFEKKKPYWNVKIKFLYLHSQYRESFL